jgi:hypothetical protein
MQWSAVTWRSANPIRPAGARTPVVPWRPVHPVFNRMLPQALPEASSGRQPVTSSNLSFPFLRLNSPQASSRGSSPVWDEGVDTPAC